MAKNGVRDRQAGGMLADGTTRKLTMPLNSHLQSEMQIILSLAVLCCAMQSMNEEMECANS